MTDDADLRARIEAQVAARRKASGRPRPLARERVSAANPADGGAGDTGGQTGRDDGPHTGPLGRATAWLFARSPAADGATGTPAEPTPADPDNGFRPSIRKDDDADRRALELPDPDPVVEARLRGINGHGAASSPSSAAPSAAPSGIRPLRPRPRIRTIDEITADKHRPRPLPPPTAAPPSTDASPAAPSIAASAPPPSFVKNPPVTAPPAGATRPGPGPDLSRFLDASESKSGDDVDDEAKEAKLARPRGGNSRFGRLLLRIVVIVAIAAGATFLLRHYVVEPYYIPSESMEPTLHGCAGCTDDRVLVDKISYRFHDPKQGDIIVFNRPPNAGDTEPQLIKRVIAVAGDKVQLRGGKVIVNGAVLNESYLSQKMVAPCGGTQKLTSQDTWTIPSGELFVMGDNRCRSNDSRFFGPIKISSVVGRAFAIFWPLGRIRTL